jgi:hypothetical protein
MWNGSTYSLNHGITGFGSRSITGDDHCIGHRTFDRFEGFVFR